MRTGSPVTASPARGTAGPGRPPRARRARRPGRAPPAPPPARRARCAHGADRSSVEASPRPGEQRHGRQRQHRPEQPARRADEHGEQDDRQLLADGDPAEAAAAVRRSWPRQARSRDRRRQVLGHEQDEHERGEQQPGGGGQHAQLQAPGRHGGVVRGPDVADPADAGDLDAGPLQRGCGRRPARPGPRCRTRPATAPSSPARDCPSAAAGRGRPPRPPRPTAGPRGSEAMPTRSAGAVERGAEHRARRPGAGGGSRGRRSRRGARPGTSGRSAPAGSCRRWTSAPRACRGPAAAASTRLASATPGRQSAGVSGQVGASRPRPGRRRS